MQKACGARLIQNINVGRSNICDNPAAFGNTSGWDNHRSWNAQPRAELLGSDLPAGSALAAED
jgi:hypothetical protein